MYCERQSGDSAVGIATGYRLDDRVVRVRVLIGSRIFFFSTSSKPALGPPSFLSNGYWGSFSISKAAEA
jgi:hypothetical protein